MDDNELNLRFLTLDELNSAAHRINSENRWGLIQQIDDLIEGQKSSLEYNEYYYMKEGTCGASVEACRKRIDELLKMKTFLFTHASQEA